MNSLAADSILGEVEKLDVAGHQGTRCSLPPAFMRLPGTAQAACSSRSPFDP
jgi:hypothetical protein